VANGAGGGRVSRVNVYTYIYSRERGRKGPEYNTCAARAGVREYRDGKRAIGWRCVGWVVVHARGPGPKASKDITIKNNVPHKSV